MYILSCSPDIAYFSVYCDQLKRRSWACNQSVSAAIQDLSIVYHVSCETLLDAIDQLTDESNRHNLKVYPQDDYPELFI